MKRHRHDVSLPPGVRPTPQRRAVLRAIGRFEGRFTALDVLERARRDEPQLGLATVYRTLELLRDAGSVRAIGDGYVGCGPSHHHHLVCTTCGRVEETELCGAPSAAELKRRHGFAAATHELDIYGTCERCS